MYYWRQAVCCSRYDAMGQVGLSPAAHAQDATAPIRQKTLAVLTYCAVIIRDEHSAVRQWSNLNFDHPALSKGSKLGNVQTLIISVQG